MRLLQIGWWQISRALHKVCLGQSQDEWFSTPAHQQLKSLCRSLNWLQSSVPFGRSQQHSALPRCVSEKWHYGTSEKNVHPKDRGKLTNILNLCNPGQNSLFIPIKHIEFPAFPSSCEVQTRGVIIFLFLSLMLHSFFHETMWILYSKFRCNPTISLHLHCNHPALSHHYL